jgi:broad specificity phosphatase PhoE
MKQIWICRHGQTDWSKLKKHTSTTDLRLNEFGTKQAKLLNTPLSKNPFTYVFSSPRVRAIETATLSGFSPEILKIASEWDYGIYEGKTSQEIGTQWDLYQEGAPQGESPEEIKKRCQNVLDLFLELDGDILLFSHGHFLKSLTSYWCFENLKLARSLILSEASISILSFEKSQKVIKTWNSTDHLSRLNM